MKFRIISDLHIDINAHYEDDNLLKFDPDAFYLIAGDTSGSYTITSNFIENHINQGVFILGNHEGYEADRETHIDTNLTKENIADKLSRDFPLTSKVSFLENQYKEIGEDIVVVGCTLYTDFRLYEDLDYDQTYAMNLAHNRMNDFRYVYTYGDTHETYRLVTPSDYVNYFNTSLNFIEETCNKFPDKKIVVVTHHAPSMKSIRGRYVTDVLSAAYASPLEDFIKAHDNIKLWCHGHIHNVAEYKFRNRAQVISCPFGYYNEGRHDLSKYLGRTYNL